MSIWRRFVRFVKSLFGAAVESVEDPVKVLEQNIRELKDQKVEFNKKIASARARRNQQEEEVEEIQERVDKIELVIKKAIKNDNDEKAKKFAKKLEDAEARLERAQENFEKIDKSVKKLEDNKESFEEEIEEKIREAKSAIEEHKMSETVGEAADAMESFEVGSIDQTHDEMVDKLEQEAAENEARMDMALESVGDDLEDELPSLEEEKAEDTVQRFKEEMGETDEEKEATELEAESIEDEILQEEEEIEKEEVDKTIGRQKVEG